MKAHFIDPRTLSPGSVMPAYAHLFEDGRGSDLVRYLKESGIQSTAALMQQQAQWVPSGTGEGHDAKASYARHCAVCHGADGAGDGPLSPVLAMRPPNLRAGPFLRTADLDNPRLAIARVIKFGVIGSDMPGHETLADGEILALAEMLAGWRR
jgi:cytochrome c oxidase cbb3-type subunit 2